MASDSTPTSDWVHSRIMVHEADLRATLRRRYPSADADDVVQESYCRLSTLRSVGHIDCPRAYLFRTAFNIVLEMTRDVREVSLHDIDATDAVAIEDDTPSPEQIAFDRAEMRRVEHALSKLPPRRRKIVWMRRVVGLPQREIARMLDLPEHVVENDACRGVRQLRQTMAFADTYA